MKRTLTAPQAATLRLLVKEGVVPYRAPWARSLARLLREGLARERLGVVTPTARGLDWIETALARRMAEATAAHGAHLPSHLRADFDTSIETLARARDVLAGRAP